MRHIHEIDIKNYKGLKEMFFSCNSINILVGPNNTGKSSILESIWIGISSLNGYKDSIDNRFADVIFKGGNKYLIHHNDENLKSEISLKLDNKSIKLFIEYCENGLPDNDNIKSIFVDYVDSIPSPLMASRGGSSIYGRVRPQYHNLVGILSEFMDLKGRDSDEQSDMKLKSISNLLYELSNEVENDHQSQKQHLVDSEKMFLYPDECSDKGSLKTLNRDFYAITEELKEDQIIPLLINKPDKPDEILYKKASESKKIFSVIDYLKKRIHYFEDIRENDGILYVYLKDDDEPLPLSSMGDGFKSLLMNSFITTLIDNGIVLLEEPEIAMHPGYLGVFANEIVSNSKNNQIFLSTHSLELIKYILKSAENSGTLDEINIVKLSRFNNGYIEREIINGTCAKEELDEINTDLRGF